MQNSTVLELARRAKIAGHSFQNTPSETKNRLLERIADALIQHTDALIEENKADLLVARDAGRSDTFLDRLKLTPARVRQMADGLQTLIALPDPVGETVDEYVLPNGLEVKKVRAPLGVVGIIYEARPNVTADAAGLTLKSGNAVVLRGSREAMNSNRAIVNLMRGVLEDEGVNPDVICFLDGMSREQTSEMLKCEGAIDVVIPRGGNALKRYVLETATMPVIASAGGNCHIYIEKDADLDMAYQILENAKVQRPSVCNAAETLLCDRAVAQSFLPNALQRLAEKGVEIRGTAEAQTYYPTLKVIDDTEFYEEYEAMVIKVALVDNVRQAVKFINNYGTAHSEAIVTYSQPSADYFLKEVDAAAVYHNASTRFTDGFELGLGAEMGISTGKLHCRGPIGLKELTAANYRVIGNGQIRK